MAHVFVTGASGFVGIHLVRRLVAEGESVRVLARPTSDLSPLDDVTFERAEGDVLDVESLKRAMDGCRRVYHLAADTTYDRSKRARTFAVNVDGTRNVLEAALATGIERMVHTSTGAAVNADFDPTHVWDETAPFQLGDTEFWYSISKSQAEQLVRDCVREHGLPVTMVNPGEVYGEEDYKLVTAGNLIEALDTPIALAFTGGTGVVYVGDIVEGLLLAMDKGRAGERYILASENFTVAQIMQVCFDYVARRRHLVVVNGRTLARLSAWLERLHIPTPAKPDVMAYACRYWFFDTTKARRDLGWRPIPGREAIQRALAWLITTHRLPLP